MAKDFKNGMFINELRKDYPWIGSPSGFNIKTVIIWFSIGLLLVATGILLFIFVQIAGLNYVLLIFVLAISWPFFMIPFIVNKAQIYAVGNKGIYFTTKYHAGRTWFEEEYSNISSCIVNYNQGNKRASFTFTFINKSDAGFMGMLGELTFHNIREPEKLLQLLKTYDVKCYEKNR